MQLVAGVKGVIQESPGVIWSQSAGGGCHQEEQGEQGHGGGHGATGVSLGAGAFVLTLQQLGEDVRFLRMRFCLLGRDKL